MKRPSRQGWVVAGLVLHALALRLQGIGAGLPEVYAGLAAAVLVALSPPLIARSQVIEVDVPLTLLVACGLLAAVFVVSPYLFLDHRSALADLAVEREHLRLGHFGSDLGLTWRSYLRAWFGGIAGPTLTLTSAAGLVVYLGARDHGLSSTRARPGVCGAPSVARRPADAGGGSAERAAGLLERVGRAADAGVLLERAALQAPRPADAARLRTLRSRILGGGG